MATQAKTAGRHWRNADSTQQLSAERLRHVIDLVALTRRQRLCHGALTIESKPPRGLSAIGSNIQFFCHTSCFATNVRYLAKGRVVRPITTEKYWEHVMNQELAVGANERHIVE